MKHSLIKYHPYLHFVALNDSLTTLRKTTPPRTGFPESKDNNLVEKYNEIFRIEHARSSWNDINLNKVNDVVDPPNQTTINSRKQTYGQVNWLPRDRGYLPWETTIILMLHDTKSPRTAANWIEPALSKNFEKLIESDMIM